MSPIFALLLALAPTADSSRAAPADADGGSLEEIIAAPEAAAEGEEGADSIAEILASEALLSDQAVIDESRWVLLDVLPRGFAQSESLEHLLARERLAPLVVPNHDLAQAFARTALFAHLHGGPAHLARDAATRLTFDIPVVDHPLVDLYIDYFTGRGRWFFERWLARADRYIPIMQKVLRARGLPEDLVYVAMIESGFSSRAVSTAKACGFWQFIGSTGKVFNLRNDVWVDERRDFIKATQAAASYLGNLFNEFHDWNLAWASYNAGEGRIRRVIAKYGERNFWQLIEHKGSLAKETQHYVPKIIAAAIVAKDRRKYGFVDVESLAPLSYEEIEVEDATEIGAVARKFNLDVDMLRELNPSLTYGITPPGRRWTLRVPSGTGAAIAAWQKGLPREERISYTHHRVQTGDSLSKVAKLHGSSIDAIRAFNRIANVKSLRVGQELIIPVAAMSQQAAVALASSERRPAASKPARIEAKQAGVSKPLSSPAKSRKPSARHVVSAGETLWSIAQRYGVSVQTLKDWNRRRGDSLLVGEALRIAKPET
jgi:membrane-bound lytic murein transglycosylase D